MVIMLFLINTLDNQTRSASLLVATPKYDVIT